jgi:hypothetical protein
VELAWIQATEQAFDNGSALITNTGFMNDTPQPLDQNSRLQRELRTPAKSPVQNRAIDG